MRRNLIKHLSPAERRVLSLIRRSMCEPESLGTEAGQSFEFLTLTSICRRDNLVIAEPDNVVTTIDERAVLAGITFCQRVRQRSHEFVSEEYEAALRACGQVLVLENRMLPIKPSTIALLVERAWLSGRDKPRITRPKAKVAFIHSVPRQGTKKWAIIQYLRERDRVSSAELQSLGASRQYISLLRLSGVIDHVTFNHYRLNALYK